MKKFGFGFIFTAIAVSAVYSSVYVDYSDTLLSCLLRFAVFFVLNFFGLMVAYELGNTLEKKIKSPTVAWIVIAAVFVLAFILCLIYKK